MTSPLRFSIAGLIFFTATRLPCPILVAGLYVAK